MIFHSKVAVTSTDGRHIRFVHGALASALADGGTVRAVVSGGKVREVVLTKPAVSCALRTGEPTPTKGIVFGVRFYRWRTLGPSMRVVEHHPRCTY